MYKFRKSKNVSSNVVKSEYIRYILYCTSAEGPFIISFPEAAILFVSDRDWDRFFSRIPQIPVKTNNNKIILVIIDHNSLITTLLFSINGWILASLPIY